MEKARKNPNTKERHVCQNERRKKYKICKNFQKRERIILIFLRISVLCTEYHIFSKKSNMSVRMFLFILLIIFVSSSTSVMLLLYYLDPLNDPIFSVLLLGTGVFLSSSSLLAPLIFFFKKIYYRGDVSILNMYSSIRQAILLTIIGLFAILLHLYQIHDKNIFWTAIITALCIEVMFQALD